MRLPFLIACSFVAIAPPPAAAQGGGEDAASYVQFTQDFAGQCTARNGVQVLVRNAHPSRRMRVWLDRIHMGQGTGDRSRTELAPGAEAEPLGCSRTEYGAQEWRLVRAAFVD